MDKKSVESDFGEERTIRHLNLAMGWEQSEELMSRLHCATRDDISHSSPKNLCLLMKIIYRIFCATLWFPPRHEEREWVVRAAWREEMQRSLDTVIWLANGNALKSRL